jgi:hypothetical protein
MSQTVDLNHIRNLLLSSQRRGDAFPSAPIKQVVVTNEGQIRTGDQLSLRERDHASVVPQEVFAWEKRRDREARIVATKLPASTLPLAYGGAHGWTYQIVPSFPGAQGPERFVFFLCHDGDGYQVYCLQPALEDHWCSPHTGHIYHDGRLCLGARFNGGAPTIESAYAKSVVWAEGIQVARHTGQFPFSANNAND